MRLRSQRQDLLATSQPISSTTATNYADLGNVEMPCSLQAVWNSGVAVNMQLSLQFSNDLVNWVDVSGSEQAISDVSGSHLWDVETGAEFVRVLVTVTGGSATFSVKFNGKVRE